MVLSVVQHAQCAQAVSRSTAPRRPQGRWPFSSAHLASGRRDDDGTGVAV